MDRSLLQGDLSVERMCALAGVSRAGYYRQWQTSAPREAENGVRNAIQQVALAHRHYGYRRIGVVLRRQGWTANHKCVLRLMRKDNLLCLRKRPFVPITTDSAHCWHIVPNLVRGLRPSRINQLWVADITYIRLSEEFAYLAVVLDAFSRRVVGWALQQRQPTPGTLIHHSDRGVQYASDEYRSLLEANAIQASMSRVGNPYDNAKAESFMKTLKAEEVDGRAYRNVQTARREIGEFIEDIYNRTRLHSALGYQSPGEFEAAYCPVPSAVREAAE